jgi:hypothetical protein
VHTRGSPAIHTGHCGSDPGIFVKTSHVHFVPLYVREASFVQEEFADAAEFSVVVPEFGSALYSILPLCINQPL